MISNTILLSTLQEVQENSTERLQQLYCHAENTIRKNVYCTLTLHFRRVIKNKHTNQTQHLFFGEFFYVFHMKINISPSSTALNNNNN